MNHHPRNIAPPFSFASTSLLLMFVLVGIQSVALAITLFAGSNWIADLLANLRMQQVIGLLVTLSLCLLHRRFKTATVIAVLIAAQIPWFMDRSTANAPLAQSMDPTATITLANVLTQNQRHEAVVADLISRDPDVMVVLELGTPLAAKLSSELADTYPNAFVRPQDGGNFGIGLYSKHPLRDPIAFTLNVPVETLAATVSIAGTDVRVFATHPVPPMGAAAFTDRNQHLALLAKRITDFRARFPQTPVVLLGDLNLTPWSPWFEQLQRDSGLRRACPGWNVTPTWYRFPGFPFGLVLDHGLISEHFSCVSHAVGPDIGSDHRSVTIELARSDSGRR